MANVLATVSSPSRTLSSFPFLAPSHDKSLKQQRSSKACNLSSTFNQESEVHTSNIKHQNDDQSRTQRLWQWSGRTFHELATLGCTRAGTIDGRCQRLSRCSQLRDVGVELFKFSFRDNGPVSRCFPFSFQRGDQFPDFSNFEAGFLSRANDLQPAQRLRWIIAARGNSRRRV